MFRSPKGEKLQCLGKTNRVLQEAQDAENSIIGSRENSGQILPDSELPKAKDFLNPIPGKNGQYWMVFPLIYTNYNNTNDNYSNEGTELKVLVRILIKGDIFSLVILDISGPERNWRFLLKKSEEGSSADVSITPGIPAKDVDSVREMIKSMGFSNINIRNDQELSLLEELDLEVLPSINKEV